MAQKSFAVVLSGCGFKDGAEITESVSTLICLSEAGIHYEVFAPDLAAPSTDHLTNEHKEPRNILHEAARIARGKVRNLKELKASNFDAVVFPGGFGAALHLCNWAQAGASCKVHPEAERVLKEFHAAEKPIGGICIAPALIARVLGKNKVTVTIGDDRETADEIKKTGAYHENCAVDDYVTDRENKVVTTPAYMYEAEPFQVFTGIRKALRELAEMA